MIGRLSCNNCNDGKQPVNRSGRDHAGRTLDGVRETCNVCHGSGWMPYRIQSMLSDAQLTERGLTAESLAHFRAEAAKHR